MRKWVSKEADGLQKRMKFSLNIFKLTAKALGDHYPKMLVRTTLAFPIPYSSIEPHILQLNFLYLKFILIYFVVFFCALKAYLDVERVAD